MADQDNLVSTDYGWATPSTTPPARKDLFWLKLPERHVYHWDEDGWHRMVPPERTPTEAKDLPHA